MNKRTALSTMSVAAVVALTLSPLSPAHSRCTHVVDSFGGYVMDSSKNCVHTSSYKGPETAVECGAEAPKKEMAKAPEPAPVAPPPAPAPEPVQSVTERITVGGKTLFAINSAKLTNDGKAAIDEVVTQLATFDKIDRIAVVGHTDSTGAASYNQALSERRAASVRDYMISQGIDQALIFSSGMGEESPIADNTTREGRKQNRRVEIDVSGDKVVVK